MVLQMGLRLSPEQQLKLVITPELKQAIQILQYSSVELEDFFQEQIVENPLLEIEYSTEMQGRSSEESSFSPDQVADRNLSVVDQLVTQLVDFSLTTLQYQICLYLLGNLDERGYLDIEQEEVYTKFKNKPEDWERCLTVIHSLEPAGIGARSLSECLEIQLKRKQASQLAIHIAQHHLEEVAYEQWEQIARVWQVDEDQVKIAVAEIRACNPYPAANIDSSPTTYIIPDIIVQLRGDELLITSNDRRFPRLSIQSEYRYFYRENKEIHHYLKPWMKSAQLLLQAIEQRKQTIHRVAKAIIDHQQEFIYQGTQFVKPLTLRQIAEVCELHESTVSRATREKYMQTPHGLFPFRFFFPSGLLNTSGQSISVRQVKQQIKQIIEKESKKSPLSDKQIADWLQKQGLIISRRTVSKYRSELGIPSSFQRRKDVRPSIYTKAIKK